jgi:hypothetical protein
MRLALKVSFKVTGRVGGFGHELSSTKVGFAGGWWVAFRRSASSPMSTAKRGAHLTLQGTPDPLQTCAHPRLTISEHTPLPHVARVGLEMQDPGNAAAENVQSNGWRWSSCLGSGQSGIASPAARLNRRSRRASRSAGVAER